MSVSQKIGVWYDSAKRLLPWREGRDPYQIWLSEIILQQTRVNQGFSYYQRFIEKYPTLDSLINSTQEDILKLWQGLGYYTRARNLYKAARIMNEKFNGEMPTNYDDLLSLPGVGEYTAAAIASLAYNEPVAAIDGNVYRVLARYFGIESAPDSSAGRIDFKVAAAELLDQENPGRHNQAMIELGALVCLSTTPLCNECPVNDSCYAFLTKRVKEFPFKKKKVKMSDRYFYYLVIFKKDKIIIRQRKENDIWALLYDFPLIEIQKKVTEKTLLKHPAWQTMIGNAKVRIRNISKEYKHVLSHQVLHTWFIEIEAGVEFRIPSAIEIETDAISQYPVPRLIERYLSERITMF